MRQGLWNHKRSVRHKHRVARVEQVARPGLWSANQRINGKRRARTARSLHGELSAVWSYKSRALAFWDKSPKCGPRLSWWCCRVLAVQLTGTWCVFLSGALSVSASICHILRHKHTHTHSYTHTLSLARALSHPLSLSLSLGYHQYKRIEGGVALETHPSSSNYASFPYSVPDFLGRLERGGCSFPVGQVPSSWKANVRGLRWPHQPNQLLLILIDDK